MLKYVCGGRFEKKKKKTFHFSKREDAKHVFIFLALVLLWGPFSATRIASWSQFPSLPSQPGRPDLMWLTDSYLRMTKSGTVSQGKPGGELTGKCSPFWWLCDPLSPHSKVRLEITLLQSSKIHVSQSCSQYFSLFSYMYGELLGVKCGFWKS